MDFPNLSPHEYSFTLCFLFHGENILMLERQKEPNLGYWNGVGGHIELGESPEQSCRREVEEETGIVVPAVRFGGVLTWESWTYERGGMYFFSSIVSDNWFRNSDEGSLAWKPFAWVMNSTKVVANIREFLPDTRDHVPPKRYHCWFDGEKLLRTASTKLPDWITPEWLQHGKFGV